MKISQKMIIVTLVIFFGVSLFLYFGGLFSDKQILGIPNINKISFIAIYGDYLNDETKYVVVERTEDITQIYEVLMSGKKTNTMQSVNDIPSHVEDNLMEIDIVDSNNTTTSLFVYKDNNGKCYIENPYVVVYEISVEAYDALTQYFIKD